MLMLLWFVGYSLEFPKRLVQRIGGHSEWNRHVMYRAIREGYVQVYRRTFHKRELISLRLTERGIDYIAERDPEALSLIYSRRDETPRSSHSSPEKIQRLHSVATGMVMAHSAGALILPAQKPSLLFAKHQAAEIIPVDVDTPYYYSSTEIRTAIQEFDPKSVSKGSRMVGIIVRGSDCYCLYDTGKSRMYWMRATEENAATSVSVLLTSRGFHIERVHQVLIGNNMNLITKLCHRPLRNNMHYFVLSDHFERCCFVTNNANGDTLLRILIHPELIQALNVCALRGCTSPRNPTRAYDAVNIDENRPVILGYTCDLLAFARIDETPDGFEQGPIVLAFDYQVAAIQRIIGPLTEVRAISEESHHEQKETNHDP